MRQVPMINGHEYDALTKGGRRVHKFKSKVRAYTKRGFRRRERHELDRVLNCILCGVRFERAEHEAG